MTRRRTRSGGRPRNARWWGRGAPPWERWEGVTVPLPGVRQGVRVMSPCGRYQFIPQEADRAAAFFPTFLRHWRGSFAGEAFELLDWQRDLVVRPLFGWLRVETATRRFRQLFLAVAKKNGKTGLAAGLGLYLLCGDREAGAQVYAAAAGEKQARLAHDDSRNMTLSSPHLTRILEVGRDAIACPATMGTYQVISSIAATKHGLNVHGLVVDELHAHRDRRLYETLRRGTSARTQPLVIVITTAGDNRESICYEEWEHARRVVEDVEPDPTLLPVLFEPEPGADWRAPATWRQSNPSLGVLKDVDYMETEALRAEREPRKLADFLRLELNVWTDVRTQWLQTDDWNACARGEYQTAEEARAAEPEDLVTLPCFVGVDLSTTTDLTSVVSVWRRPLEDDEASPAAEVDVGNEEQAQLLSLNYSIEIRTLSFMPEERLVRREQEDNAPYRDWVRDGWLVVTPGAIVDYTAITRELHRLREGHDVREIGFDPYNATDWSTACKARGYPLVIVRQGQITLSPACKALEALLLSGRVVHDGSPVTRWAVRNTEVVTYPNGNIMPKKTSSLQRIDPVAALVTALARLMLMPAKPDSPYKYRGVRSV